jgi:phosphoglycerate dehydrogenase-like enzyme
MNNKMEKPKVAITIGKVHYPRMFSQQAWNALESFADVIHHSGQDPANKQELMALLQDVDAIITSWDVACIDADVVAAAPKLKAMAHMGSSVKRFVSDAFWQQGIQLTSAGIALARSVAETTLGLMIVGQKRIWPLGQHVREGGWRNSPAWDKWFSRELYRKNVGIVGASNVGRYVIELLKPFGPNVLLYDPYVSEEQAIALGTTKVDLNDLLSRSDIVSLHAPANKSTYQLLNAAGMALMKDDALIINTGRGSLIEEAALIKELSKGRFFAFLDVTDPEPPALDNPLRSLDNVVISPHIAGCIENCNQMGELAVEELRRFFAGEPAVYQITPEMFERIS